MRYVRFIPWFLFVNLCSAQTYDLIIRGGWVVDGTGNPGFHADIALRDGKIQQIGHILPNAPTKGTIEAKGKVVTPGFFDIHNHSDPTLLVDGNAESMIRQGVTSMILGEGMSAAPVGGKQEQGTATGLEISRDQAGWTDFAGYFTKLLQQGISTNVGSFVGSSQIWTYVRGPRSGPPTASELAAMSNQVRIAMRQGALGVSSSLSGPPGSWIDTPTLLAMCQAAAPYGGRYATHMRTEGHGVFEALREALEIGAKAGVPVDITHLKIAEHELWGKMPDLVAEIAVARTNGQDVQANVYPYRAGQNNLSAIIPPWAQEGGPGAMIARLKDSALRPRLEKEILHGIPGSAWYNHFTATGGWEGVMLVSLSNPKYAAYAGQRMNQVISSMGKSGIDVLFELLVENQGSVPAVYFHHTEEDMRTALRQPWTSIGSDGAAIRTDGPLRAGNPHPRFYGTFPRVIARYVRESKVLTLEEAIRKMTSANAAKAGQWDRGMLRPGFAADIVIFDLARIADRATFTNPHQYAEGIDYVLVNGQVVMTNGRHTGARPGVILYGPGKATMEE